jgi:hypothetical protein
MAMKLDSHVKKHDPAPIAGWFAPGQLALVSSSGSRHQLRAPSQRRDTSGEGIASFRFCAPPRQRFLDCAPCGSSARNDIGPWWLESNVGARDTCPVATGTPANIAPLGSDHTARWRLRLLVLVNTTPATITAPPSSANTVGVSPSTIHDTSTPNTGTR